MIRDFSNSAKQKLLGNVKYKKDEMGRTYFFKKRISYFLFAIAVFFSFLILGLLTHNVGVSLLFGFLLIFGIWNCIYHYSKKYAIGNGYIEESGMLKSKKLIAYVDISKAKIKQGDNVTYILLYDKRSKRPIIKINMYYENTFLLKELAYKMNWLK